jgi:AcrR family transcriptional regulator
VATDKLTPDRRRELTRAALVESARHVFAQKGFEGASLDEIAAEAGFTRGAIYKHFSNKEDLFFAVLSQFNEGTLDAFAKLIDADYDAATDPTSIAHLLVESEMDPELWALGVEFGLYEYRNPSTRERSAAHRRENLDRVSEFMEQQGRSYGFGLRVPAKTAAAILLTTTDAFVHAARLNPDAEATYATFLELILPAMFDFPDRSS